MLYIKGQGHGTGLYNTCHCQVRPSY